MAPATLPTPQKATKWVAIKRGDGKVTGHIEMWFSKGIGRWVTIPGASRFSNAGA